MKFIADSTVGKLGRLLRMAGFDTAYIKEYDISEVISLSLQEQRMILSRDSVYESNVLAANFYHLNSDQPNKQLLEVISAQNLTVDKNEFLTRCLNCNEILVEIDKESVKDKVYPYVYQTQRDFKHCSNCNKFFWQATHAKAMRKKLEKLILENM